MELMFVKDGLMFKVISNEPSNHGGKETTEDAQTHTGKFGWAYFQDHETLNSIAKHYERDDSHHVI